MVTFLHPEWTAPIQSFCRQKNLSPERFNDLTQILNPAELGARVAEKWNLPGNLVVVLRHQSRPRDAGEELFEVTTVVAVSRAQSALEQNPRAEPIGSRLLADLGLDAPGRFPELVRRIGEE